MGLAGLTTVLRSKAVRKGLLGGSRAWTTLGVVLYLAKGVRWLTQRRQEVLLVETIAPGETLEISTRRPGRRHGR